MLKEIHCVISNQKFHEGSFTCNPFFSDGSEQFQEMRERTKLARNGSTPKRTYLMKFTYDFCGFVVKISHDCLSWMLSIMRNNFWNVTSS